MLHHHQLRDAPEALRHDRPVLLSLVDFGQASRWMERAPQPNTPPVVPNYRLLRCIGSGTFGEVWLSLDVFHHWAAVKVVRRSTGAGVRNQDQEFRGLKRYVTVAGTDRSLMPVTNVGEDAGGRFFHYAMEIADDAVTGLPLPPIVTENLAEAAGLAALYRPLTLKEKLRLGRLSSEECIRHGIALAEALEYLHQHGLVHRDVKPSNIILVSGRAKLADIGLVSSPDATQVSQAGTPEFVPLHGAGRATGDIFALGKVLYLMANGRPLEDFPELIEGHADLPMEERVALAELGAIYDRACDPDPALRQASAQEFGAELERLQLAGSVLQLRRQERETQQRQTDALAATRRAQEREAEFGRRLRIVSVLGLVGVLAVLGVLLRSVRAESAQRAAVAALEGRQLARMEHRVQGWAANDWQAIHQAVAARPDDVMLRQAVATLAGLDARNLGHWTGVQATSAAFSPAGDLVLSGYGTNRASLITHGTNRVELPVAGEGKVAWARDGEPLVFQIEPGKAVLRDARTGRVRREFPLEAGETGHVAHAPVAALSTDGTRAAAILENGDVRRLALWNTETGRLLAETNFTASVLAFAPDQSLLGAGHVDGSLTVFRLEPFAEEISLPAALGPNSVQAIAFGKDYLVPLAGTSTEPRWLLAAGDRATGIVIWELAAHRPRSFCRGSRWEVQSVAFHPNGVTLASAGRLGVNFWDVASGQSLLWANENGNKTRALAFNKDGSWLAAGSTDESITSDVSLWELEPDRGIQRLRGLATPIRNVKFSPDGGCLAALSDEWHLGVWEIPSGRLLRIFELAASTYADNAGCAFDADHRRLAFAGGTSARIFELGTGQTLATWDLPNGKLNNMQFTSDGRLFLGRVERDPGATSLQRWNLYELPPGQPALRRHGQSGTHDTAINLTLTAGAARLLVLSKDRQTGSNHLAAIEVVSGRETWRLATGNSKNWEVLRVDPTGSRCAAVIGPGVEKREMALLNVDDGQTIVRFSTDCLALSPVGTEYADSRQITHWHQRDREDHQPALLMTSDGNPIGDTYTFSPDGKRIAFGSEEGAVFVMNLAEVRRRVAGLHAPSRIKKSP